MLKERSEGAQKVKERSEGAQKWRSAHMKKRIGSSLRILGRPYFLTRVAASEKNLSMAKITKTYLTRRGGPVSATSVGVWM